MKEINLGIILGFKLKENGEMTNILKKRLDRAIDFYKEGKIQKLLLSGGLRKNGISEAQAMYNYLTKNDIPKNVLFKEEKSLDTFGNAIFCKKIVGKIRPVKIIIFTSDYHVHRSKLIFKNVFGKNFKIEFVKCGGWNIPIFFYIVSGYEKKMYRITQLFLKTSKEGDEKSIMKKVFSLHPFYVKNLEKLRRISDEDIAEKLGVSTKDVGETRKFLNMYLNKK